MANKAAFTEDLLHRCRALGRVRVVVRNATGLSELFADLARLEQSGGWANLITPHAHVHLTPRAFGAVAFRTVRGGNGRSAPAVWLYASEGCPTVLFILDQLSGAAAEEQAEAYGQLASDFGPFMYLVSSDPQPPQVTTAHVHAGTAPH